MNKPIKVNRLNKRRRATIKKKQAQLQLAIEKGRLDNLLNRPDQEPIPSQDLEQITQDLRKARLHELIKDPEYDPFNPAIDFEALEENNKNKTNKKQSEETSSKKGEQFRPCRQCEATTYNPNCERCGTNTQQINFIKKSWQESALKRYFKSFCKRCPIDGLCAKCEAKEKRKKQKLLFKVVKV